MFRVVIWAAMRAAVAVIRLGTRVGFHVGVRGHKLGLVVEEHDEFPVRRVLQVDVLRGPRPDVRVQRRGRQWDAARADARRQDVQVETIQRLERRFLLARASWPP